MPAEKTDGQSEADSANADYPGIVFPQRCFPDRHLPDQLSELFPEQNPEAPLHVYSLEHTSECAIRPACCSSSPGQKLASRSQAAPGVLAVAALLSTSVECKVAGPRG